MSRTTSAPLPVDDTVRRRGVVCRALAGVRFCGATAEAIVLTLLSMSHRSESLFPFASWHPNAGAARKTANRIISQSGRNRDDRERRQSLKVDGWKVGGHSSARSTATAVLAGVCLCVFPARGGSDGSRKGRPGLRGADRRALARGGGLLPSRDVHRAGKRNRPGHLPAIQRGALPRLL